MPPRIGGFAAKLPFRPGRLSLAQNQNPFIPIPTNEGSAQRGLISQGFAKGIITTYTSITFSEKGFLLDTPHGGYQESKFFSDGRHVPRPIPSFYFPILITHCDPDILARDPFVRGTSPYRYGRDVLLPSGPPHTSAYTSVSPCILCEFPAA